MEELLTLGPSSCLFLRLVKDRKPKEQETAVIGTGDERLDDPKHKPFVK